MKKVILQLVFIFPFLSYSQLIGFNKTFEANNQTGNTAIQFDFANRNGKIYMAHASHLDTLGVGFVLSEFDYSGNQTLSSIYHDTSGVDFLFGDLGFSTNNDVVAVSQAGEDKVMRFDDNNNLVWSRKINDATFSVSYSNIACDEHGNSYVAGGNCGAGSMSVLKLDESGSLMWSKVYQNAGGSAVDIKVLEDGNIVVLGSYSPDAILLLKIDTSGGILFSKKYSDANFRAGASKLIELSNNQIVVTGSVARKPDFYFEPYLLKLNQSGDILYQYAINHIHTDSTWVSNGFSNFLELNDNNILARYSIGNNVNNRQSVVTKVSTQGNILWSKSLGFYSNNINHLFQTSDDSLYFGGYSSYDTRIFKTDESISACVDESYFPFVDTLNFISQIDNYSANLLVNVEPDSLSRNIFTWTQNIACTDTVENDLSGLNIDNEEKIKIYPNPTHQLLFIDYQSTSKGRLRLFNIYGQLLKDEDINNHYELDLQKLPTGIYIIAIENGKTLYKKRVIKE